MLKNAPSFTLFLFFLFTVFIIIWMERAAYCILFFFLLFIQNIYTPFMVIAYFFLLHITTNIWENQGCPYQISPTFEMRILGNLHRFFPSQHPPNTDDIICNVIAYIYITWENNSNFNVFFIVVICLVVKKILNWMHVTV